MIFTFNRDHNDWVHPLYRRGQLQQMHMQPSFESRPQYMRDMHLPTHHTALDAMIPVMETMNALNHMLHLAQHQPRVVQSLASQREAAQRKKFELAMSITEFGPDEIDVKMVDNFLVVEAKHEEKEDEFGLVFRHFIRRYKIPDDVKPETITCNLSSDGILHVHAPRMIEDKKETAKSIPINFTGKPAPVPVTQNGEEKK